MDAMTKRERIARAVNDESWQEFRLTLKGKSTSNKLEMLRKYWNGSIPHGHGIRYTDVRNVFQYDCDVCIRVDNYIKALCRGGQLFPGEDLYSVLYQAWSPKIKKD